MGRPEETLQGKRPRAITDSLTEKKTFFWDKNKSPEEKLKKKKKVNFVVLRSSLVMIYSGSREVTDSLTEKKIFWDWKKISQEEKLQKKRKTKVDFVGLRSSSVEISSSNRYRR